MRWADIAFEMPADLTKEICDAWSWLVPEPWEPILCSRIGGIFLRSKRGEVLWLDTAVALVDPIAATVDEFNETCRSNSEIVHEWFGTALVDKLHSAGKVAGPGDCYGFTFLPVFAEGKYEPDNMFVAPIREVLIGNAKIHNQISDLPDGSSVQIKVVD